MPTSVTVTLAMGRDGIEKPSHPARMGMPNGLGRARAIESWYATTSTAMIAPRNVKRGRHRRNASRAMIVPHRRIRIHHWEETAFTSSATFVSHPVRRDVTHRERVASQWSNKLAAGLKN